MAKEGWSTKNRAVTSLHLDSKNPRIGREIAGGSPRDIVQYLFEHDKAIEVAQSIAMRGFFPNEPLLAIKEGDRLVVVEGNRRLAALKALREPGLLEGAIQRQVERLSRQIHDLSDIASVPVTLAPSRRATDRQVAGRHIGTPVLAWQAENRASFILDKLAEGYSNDQLRDQLGFSTSDIQAARQTRAIAEMARSLDLPDELKAKLDKPRTKVFSTLGRVFDSTVGRKHLIVVPDAEHGFRGETSKTEFLKVFTRLVSDIVLGHQSSRTLNTNEQIEEYFRLLPKEDRAEKKRGTFVPGDIIKGRSVASDPEAKTERKRPPLTASKTIIPRDFKVRHGDNRLVEIRKELGKLKRDDFPNAGAVMLRVFLELSLIDYLERTGELEGLIRRLEKKTGGRLPFGTPTMRQLVPEAVRIAKRDLKPAAATRIEKALRYDPAAPFTISELHGFVHQTDLPSPRDIEQFWARVEPLFRLMLEEPPKVVSI